MAERNRGVWWLVAGGGLLLLAAGGTASASSSPPLAGGPNTDAPLEYETDDRIALGRIIHSECGNQSLPERSAVAWCARNMAQSRRAVGGSIARLVCQPCGRSAGYSRPFSSALRARPQDLELAGVVLSAPQSLDVTDGATNCFMPGLQDRLFAAGRVKDNADAIRRRWTTKYKFERYGSVGAWELYGARRSSPPSSTPPSSVPTSFA